MSEHLAAPPPSEVTITVYGEQQEDGSFRVYVKGCGFRRPYQGVNEVGFPRVEWTYPGGERETYLVGVFTSGCLDTRYATMTEHGNYGVTVGQYDEAGNRQVGAQASLSLP